MPEDSIKDQLEGSEDENEYVFKNYTYDQMREMINNTFSTAVGREVFDFLHFRLGTFATTGEGPLRNFGVELLGYAGAEDALDHVRSITDAVLKAGRKGPPTTEQKGEQNV